MAELPSSTAFLGIAELGHLLRTRQTSSVQLTEFYLDRLRRYGTKLNAVVTVTDELALRQARQADRELAAGHDRGPLHGIPCGVKDLLDTAGIRTTWGAPPFADRVPREDATAVVKLREAGAVLIGKLAMIELAGGGDYNTAAASLTGPARNPWNPQRWTGGSSSGPGAAVAAGLVGFAIASESWGSIVNPSTYCGVTGLRPTYGRIGRGGAMTLSWTLDKLGPMARRIADLGPILSALAGPDASDSASLPGRFVSPRLPRSLKGYRLGYFSVAGLYDDNPAKQPYLAALEVFRSLGATVVETQLPEFPYDEARDLIGRVDAASSFEPLLQHPEQLQKLADPFTMVGLYANAQIKAVDYLRVMRMRTAAQQALLPYLAGFDALVGIGAYEIAYLIDVDFDAQDRQAAERSRARYGELPAAAAAHNYWLSNAGNLLGLPGVAVSMGFSNAEHMPVGLELMAGPLREARLLQVAHAYEQATPWHRQHPDLAGR